MTEDRMLDDLSEWLHKRTVRRLEAGDPAAWNLVHRAQQQQLKTGA